MAEKNSSKPMQVKKPVRTARTPRAFPGQPAEVEVTPRGSVVLPQDVFLKMMKGELDPERTQEILAGLQGAAFVPRGPVRYAGPILEQTKITKPAPIEIDPKWNPDNDPEYPEGMSQTLEQELESRENPHVLVMDAGSPARVRVAIAKFATQELFPGSNMLVAGAYLDDESLVHLARSLMTIAHRRGLVCQI